jgi:hypothetical protein
MTGGNGKDPPAWRIAFDKDKAPSIGMEQRVPPIRRQRAGGNYLMADSEFDKNLLVALGITVFQVGEEATPLRDHGQESSPGGMIFLMGFEMGFELGETPAQNCDLNLGGTGIALVNLIGSDDLPLCFCC